VSGEVTAIVAVVMLVLALSGVVLSVATRLTSLEAGSAYKDRRLDALETAVSTIQADIKELLGMTRRIYGARKVDASDEGR
jgi:cell division protein FtsL